MNVGLTSVEEDKLAVLPVGFEVRVQRYVSKLLSASVLPLPSSDAVEPVVRFWATPAFATGIALDVLCAGTSVVPPPPPPPQPARTINAKVAKSDLRDVKTVLLLELL